MNYYNPYYMAYPYFPVAPKLGLFQRIFGNINFSSILSGTQKTLNIVNQGIPLIKQAKPIVKNAKTMFKIMNEFKKVDTPKVNNTKEIINNNNPTFFA